MPRLRNIVVLTGDLSVLILSYLAAFFFLRPTPLLDIQVFFDVEQGWTRLGWLLLTLVLGLYYLGLYQQITVQSRRLLAENLTVVFGAAFVLQGSLNYASGSMFMPRSVMLVGSIMAFPALILWRTTFTVLVLQVAGYQKVLFWGDTPLARELAAHIAAHPEKGFVVAGVVRTEPPPGADPEFPAGKEMPVGPDLLERIAAVQPHRISVSGILSLEESLAEPLLKCSMSGMSVENLGELYELLMERVSLETLTLNQLIFSPTFRPARWKLLCQDFYGRLFAILGILATWPLMVLTAIAVRLDSPGPVLFRQKRLGQNGHVFHCLKFRSMFVDGDERFGVRRTTEKGDPRVTRVGRVIRILRVDELPQFFNVLRGEMAFVGPRPEMPVFAEKLAHELPLFEQRYRVKPGITGWAQLFHEPEVTLEQTRRKLEYDLYYIKNMSPVMDFVIAFHTVRTLVQRKGAR